MILNPRRLDIDFGGQIVQFNTGGQARTTFDPLAQLQGKRPGKGSRGAVPEDNRISRVQDDKDHVDDGLGVDPPPGELLPLVRDDSGDGLGAEAADVDVVVDQAVQDATLERCGNVCEIDIRI